MPTLEDVAIRKMEVNGCNATLKQAKRLTDNGRTNALPPGDDLHVIPLSCLPGCPDSWLRGENSFVVPVDTEVGLWFDFRSDDNNENLAIIPSVKGMNPITGTKIEHLNLEQYRNKCPKHDCDLESNNYCPQCDYIIPSQNYISYPNKMWWDGFRQPDGCVRQFFFTEDDVRDIASHVIGKENTVPAFGFAFYKTKEPRFERSNFNTLCRGIYTDNSNDFDLYSSNTCYSTQLLCHDEQVHVRSMSSNSEVKFAGQIKRRINVDQTSNKLLGSSSPMSSPKRKVLGSYSPPKRKLKQSNKDVSIGAGAKIDQELIRDDLELSKYKDEPEALIRLYFVFKQQLDQIVKQGGIRDQYGSKEGYLEGLPVG